MHWHLMRFPNTVHNPAGYYIFWDKVQADMTLKNHSKCCYVGHIVVQCQHPECLVGLMAV